jgi:tetratricopeptide (TPR) repeat protein
MLHNPAIRNARHDRLSCLLRLAVLLLAPVVTSPALPAQTGTLPDLPQVVVDEFSAPVRKQILAARAVAQASPQDAPASARLGKILHTYKLMPPAITCYRRARLLDPGDREVVYYLGIARLQSGDDVAALADLRETLRLMPDYQPARLRLAELLLKSGDIDEAIRLFETILRAEPDTAWALHGLGQAYASRGDAEAAIRYYEQAVAQYERFGPAHYALGLLYRDRGDAGPARQHLERYRLHPKETPPYNDPLLEALLELDISPSTQIRRAQLLLHNGQTDEAEKLLRQAVEADPQSVPGHSELVRLYHQTSDFDKARQHYEAAVALYPGAVLAGLEYGNFLAERGRFDEAAATFARVLEYHPGDADAHGLLGQAYEELGRTEEASHHYQAALESDPTNRHANFLLGRHLLASGRADDARIYLDRATSTADRETAMYLYQTALACHSAREHDLALSYLQRARTAAADSGQQGLHGQIMQTLANWQGATRR